SSHLLTAGGPSIDAGGQAEAVSACTLRSAPRSSLEAVSLGAGGKWATQQHESQSRHPTPLVGTSVPRPHPSQCGAPAHAKQEEPGFCALCMPERPTANGADGYAARRSATGLKVGTCRRYSPGGTR